jgi:hypothetical protein
MYIPLVGRAAAAPSQFGRAIPISITMPHPHLGATYEVVHFDDVTAEVIVTIPDMQPTTVKGFASKASAKKWIKRHEEAVAAGSDPRKPKFWRRRGRTA